MSTKCDWLFNNSGVRIYFDYSDDKVHIETIGKQILTDSDLKELLDAITDHFNTNGKIE